MSEWDRVKFGQMFETIYRYPTYYGINYVDKGVPEIRGELLTTDGRIVDDYRYITFQDASRFPKVRLKEGDFIISVRGTIGKVGIAEENHINAVITANLLRLSPDRSKVDIRWLLQVLTSQGFQGQLENACSQTTIRTIQIPLLYEILIDRPLISEQKKIAKVLSTALLHKQTGLDAVN